MHNPRFGAQELPQPELQPLAMEAKSAAVLLKYLPLPAAVLPRALATLSDGVRAELWPARAAALVFVQVADLLYTATQSYLVHLRMESTDGRCAWHGGLSTRRLCVWNFDV